MHLFILPCWLGLALLIHVLLFWDVYNCLDMLNWFISALYTQKKKKKKSLPLVVVTLHISPQIYFCKNIILCSTSTSFPFPALSCSGAELISALPEVLLALIPRLRCRSGVSPGRGAQQRASAHRSSLPQHRSPRPGSSQLLRCCVWDVGLLADRHASSP